MSSISIPDTPAGRQARAWLDFVGRGELTALREFAAEHLSVSALAERSAEQRAEWECHVLHRDTRGLVPAQVERSSETQLSLLVRAQLTGEWLRVHLATEGEPPHLIERLGVWFLAPWEPPFGPALSQAELVSELRALVDRLAGADLFSGAVLLARGDDLQLECAQGLARREDGLPNTPATRFNVGSITKMFTAVAVAQLVERGRLGLGDRLSEHLPDYPRAVAEKVTVHQLLSHTSGLQEFISERFEANLATVSEVADYLPLFADEPLLFEPGTKASYSNAGYAVLGALIEQVSGQDYYQYIREHIYRPAGMLDSDSYDLDCDQPTLAIGYTSQDANRQPTPGRQLQSNLGHPALPPRGGPFGCGFSTVGDLHRFGQALLRNELLPPELTQLVVSGKTHFGPNRSYAYGFDERCFAGLRSIGHGGGAPGANAQFALYPALGDTLVVLANIDPPICDRIADYHRRLRCAQRAAGCP